MPLDSNKISHKKNIKRFESNLKALLQKHPQAKQQNIIIVSVALQTLYLVSSQKILASYSVSTAEAGTGNLSGSFKTPLGVHQITEKIGGNAPLGTIFKARENTLKIANILIEPNSTSDDDIITSRILWLDGLEEGVNKGVDADGNTVDSHSRYIYIHGTNEEGRLGQAVSHGCVRMANQDVIELFDKVETGDLVLISEK